MRNKTKILDRYFTLEEMDQFCHKLGLTSEDWDEGGGFVHEAVIRVVLESILTERKRVATFLNGKGQPWIDVNIAYSSPLEIEVALKPKD